MPVKESLQSKVAALWPFTFRSVPWIALAVAVYLFLASNVDLARDLQWHDGQRLGQLVLLALVVAALLMPGAARQMTAVWFDFRLGIRAALASAFALGLISSILAPLSRWALLEWGMLWLLLVVVLSIAAQRRHSGDCLDQWFVMLFFATATAYTISVCAIYVVMLLIGPVYGQIFDTRELFPSFSNLRFFGHIQTMLLPFLLLPALWWGTTWLRRVMLWSVPAIWWMLLIVSGTRGTWIALLVGVVAVSIYGGRLSRSWIRIQFTGLFFGLLCYALFIMLIPRLMAQPVWFLQRPGDIVTLSLRDVIWTKALEFTGQHSWLGVGPMHYAYFANEVAAHPHNAVLQWLAEWGIPAALLLTGVCAVAGLAYAAHVRRAVEVSEDRKAWIQIALLAALAGAAAQAMVDGVLVMPVSQILLALLCGWAVGVHLEGRKSAPRRLRRAEHALVLAVVGIAAIVVAYGVTPEMGHIAEREKAYLSARPPDTLLLPRFWTQGWINE